MLAGSVRAVREDVVPVALHPDPETQRLDGPLLTETVRLMTGRAGDRRLEVVRIAPGEKAFCVQRLGNGHGGLSLPAGRGGSHCISGYGQHVARSGRREHVCGHFA